MTGILNGFSNILLATVVLEYARFHDARHGHVGLVTDINGFLVFFQFDKCDGFFVYILTVITVGVVNSIVLFKRRSIIFVIKVLDTFLN